MRIIEISPLSERLVELIEEYSECNVVTRDEVLDALLYAYACVEREGLEEKELN
ncbi:hypothetical protein [Bradyrhizobium sp. BR 10289]|uniref:hypothetical protein n=1 Tax=Bradyrhizobium sp. BR 10289 TaxID=2749993 RepID=UPI001C6517FD|nr:hypothetical protein [Bradyrhizobium sp. BR 10289]MBW7970968.1 hypothetical protein [Bradyrhizobium sp. BR 10289]